MYTITKSVFSLILEGYVDIEALSLSDVQTLQYLKTEKVNMKKAMAVLSKANLSDGEFDVYGSNEQYRYVIKKNPKE